MADNNISELDKVKDKQDANNINELSIKISNTESEFQSISNNSEYHETNKYSEEMEMYNINNTNDLKISNIRKDSNNNSPSNFIDNTAKSRSLICGNSVIKNLKKLNTNVDLLNVKGKNIIFNDEMIDYKINEDDIVLKRKNSLNIEPTTSIVFPTKEIVEKVDGNNNDIYNYKLDTKNEYCDICFQDIKDKYTLPCGDFFCKDCITQHLSNCLSNVTLFKNLRCPKSICFEKVKENVLEKILSEKEFKKYSQIKQKIEGLYNPSNIPCPIPNCDSYNTITSIRNGNLICLNQHKFCVKCLKESHEQKNCLKEEDESVEYLNQHKLIKRCPNCRSWVEKEPEGCNNVTCANIWCCLTFCWICMNTYDKSHYNNPLSTCFGMQVLKDGSRFAQHKCLRITKCILIFFLMLCILPFVILLFSFVFITFYILAFVLDGSAVKNLKLKTERRQKLFRFLIYATYISLSMPSIPLGYWSLCLLIVSSPFIYLYKKIKRITKENQETEA